MALKSRTFPPKETCLKEDENIYTYTIRKRKENKKESKSKKKLDIKDNEYLPLEVYDNKSAQRSTLRKILSHIPVLSCISCSSKKPKYDESQSNKLIPALLSIKEHPEWHKHPRPKSPSIISLCRRSKMSFDASSNSQSIQFLDDDILDHANYLTHPIYFFHYK
uniref:Uncharacterized protein n=1 Tax=Parastrongyloides trichosuri TaxID=131310 RepID=A0A0N5A609_PARTI